MFSKAGRDCGGYFVVLAVEGDYVYICNGTSRKVDNPKKKNLKHIALTNSISEFIKEKTVSEGKINNSDVRRVLEEFCGKAEA